MKKNQEEVRVVSRNAMSKLRLVQFILLIAIIVGIIGSINNPIGFYYVMIAFGFIGIVVIRILRWLHRD